MVEANFLAVVVGVFLVILVVILRSGSSGETKTAKNQREKPNKPQKAKKGNSKRPNKRLNENPLAFTPYHGTSANENDAKEILEFLKGKDPNEAAKQYTNQQKQQKQNQNQNQNQGNKKRRAKNEPTSSEETLAKGSDEGFTVIKKEKKQKDKAKKENEGEEKQEKKGKRPKFFYKAGIYDADTKDQRGRGRKKRKQDDQTGDSAAKEEQPEGEPTKKRQDKAQNDGESEENKPKREKRERKEGEKSSESDGSGREKKREGPPPARRAFTASAPNVKYEQAPLDDILQSISTSYQPKSKGVRYKTAFSQLSRTLVLDILHKLEAKDIVALSRVNHYFNNITRREDIWEALAKRDFGIKELGKYRNFRAAYKGEYIKRRSQKRKEEKDKKRKEAKKEDIPLDDVKDKKGRKEEKKNEETQEE